VIRGPKNNKIRVPQPSTRLFVELPEIDLHRRGSGIVGASLFVRPSFEELQVAVSGFWCEREFGVAAGPEHSLDLFEAESFGAEDGCARVPCAMRFPRAGFPS
jgi:hypothetical protein